MPADAFGTWLRNATPDSVSNGTTVSTPAPASPPARIELPVGVEAPGAFKATA